MDANTWLQLIGSYGFPIVMCLLMYKYMLDSNEQHREETKQITEALNNNTITIQKLVDSLDNKV